MFVSRTGGRRGRLAEQRGAALVELAIVLPLLMVLLLGMLDFGQAFNSWIDETHLANTGARLAAVNYPAPTCTGANQSTCLAQYIQQTADLAVLKTGRSADSYAPAQSAAQVCISFPPVAGHANPLVGDPVQVTVSVNYRWLNYVSSKLSLGTTKIVGKAAMRLEGAPSNYAAGCYP
jgi:Flp pilus assembly protein TadG